MARTSARAAGAGREEAARGARRVRAEDAEGAEGGEEEEEETGALGSSDGEEEESEESEAEESEDEGSGGEEEGEDGNGDGKEDIDELITTYLEESRRRYEAKAARREAERAERDLTPTGEALRRGSFADRREGAVMPEDDEDDSSDDEREVNVMGRGVPLEWYREEDHIGYTVDGERIMKPEAQDRMAGLISRSVDPDAWRTIHDEYNGTTVTLTDAEIRMIRRMRTNRFPHSGVDPYPEEDFDVSVERDAQGRVAASPLSSAPEPKRRFLPSKWEAKMVVRMVRAMRRGWMKMRSEEEAKRREEEDARASVYLMWGDGGDEESARTGAGLPYIPAPKVKLPGHEESYNPPEEYLPTEEERAKWESGLEERPQFVPQRCAARAARAPPSWAPRRTGGLTCRPRTRTRRRRPRAGTRRCAWCPRTRTSSTSASTAASTCTCARGRGASGWTSTRRT